MELEQEIKEPAPLVIGDEKPATFWQKLQDFFKGTSVSDDGFFINTNFKIGKGK